MKITANKERVYFSTMENRVGIGIGIAIAVAIAIENCA